MDRSFVEKLIVKVNELTRRMERLESQEGLIATADGGMAIRLTAGENLSRGNVVVVKQSGGTDGSVWKAPTSGNEQDMPIGIVYKDALSGERVLVVVAGIAYGLPEGGVTATRGYVVYVSGTTAGTLTEAAGIGTAQHWRECGHWLDTGSGAGALTRMIIHFN